MPNKFIDWGTKVKFRVRQTKVKQECKVELKVFTGKSHSDEANKFVSENKQEWDFFCIIPFGSF